MPQHLPAPLKTVPAEPSDKVILASYILMGANGAEAWPTARPTTDESKTVLCIDKTGNAVFPAWFVEASDILMQDGWV